MLLAAPAVAADVKIGYVDLQKALNLSEAGKSAKEKIAKTVKEYEGTVEARQKELKRIKDDLDKQSLVLSETARGDKEREYQQKLKEFQRFTKDIQEELQQKDTDFTRQILEELLKVIREIGQKEGYTLLFEQTESSLLYADAKIDITDKVIKTYDSRSKK
ncbi:MAG: OmpH family outer membrane protein [Desulfuromonadales bacterium]|nr:OmpH family outer membrane protein [Desulfuromonadales bacterium]